MGDLVRSVHVDRLSRHDSNFFSTMKEMNYDQSVEIDDSNVVDYNHLRRLARMLDISNDDIRESYYSAKHRLGIKKRVTEKIFKHESLKNRFNERLEVERKRFEQKKADDEFFKQLYPRPDPLSNPFEFNKRESLKNRFRERLDKERTQIKTSKAAYKAMLDKLMTEPVLLRPLPPKEMIPLKPYSVKLFEKENEELINYFDKFGHEFKSSNPEYLTINEPNDEEKAKAAFEKKKYHGTQIVNKTHDKKPIVVYYLNETSSTSLRTPFTRGSVSHSRSCST